MKNSTSIRIPKDLIDKIDEIIEKGYYQSRAEYVTFSIRYALIFYADLRGAVLDNQTAFFRNYTLKDVPKPIDDNVSGLGMLKGTGVNTNAANSTEKATESTIAMYYRLITRVYLEAFDNSGGDMVQVSFQYPAGLRERAKILAKMAYGFGRKMDFVKASIICLLTKTMESDKLYDDIHRYISETKEFQKSAVSGMLLNFFGGMSTDDVIKEAVGKLFDEDEETDV